MTHSVERRATETQTEGDLADHPDVLEPFLRSSALDGESTRSDFAAQPANQGLTGRERKVKDLLLNELKDGSDIQLLSYEEIQNIEKTLNVGWIDAELGKMRSAHRKTPWLYAVYGAFMLFYTRTMFGGLDELVLGNLSSVRVGLAMMVVLAAITAPYFQRRALSRRIFIFEALRELAGADEPGVTLDQAVQDADALITRIVDGELAGEAAKPAKTIGRRPTN